MNVPVSPSALAHADLVVNGRMLSASNATLRCTLQDESGAEVPVVYKPVAGERPLWDFPDGSLAGREVAAYALAEAVGWNLVPLTVWREDGPAGPGMCQAWVEDDPDVTSVDIVPVGTVPAGWHHVLDARDASGAPVSLVHRDIPDLARMALFDAVVNNADRKGGHILVDADGRSWGIDHGVTFSDEPKLRTVLWGWSGEPLSEGQVADLERLQGLLDGGLDDVERWLTVAERRALRRRVRTLLAQAEYPSPDEGWPAIPWPVF